MKVIKTLEEKQNQVNNLCDLIDQIHKENPKLTDIKFLQKVKYIKEHVEQKDIDIFESFLLSHDEINGEYTVDCFQQMMGISLVKLLGVQPMQGPVGLMYKLRWLFNTDVDTKNKDEDIMAHATIEMQSTAIQASIYKYDNFKQDLFHLFFTKITNVCKKYKCAKSSLIQVTYEATNNIARLTRRGVGNILITHSSNIEDLQFLADKKVLTIIIDNMMPENIILTGYKGISEIDAGIFFCPYMISPNNVIRCAFHSDDVSKDYYSLIEITDAK